MTAFLIIICILNLIIIVSFSIFVYKINERINTLENAVVRGIMEEDFDLPDKVIQSAKALHSVTTGDRAIREARRLYGLKP